MVTTRETFPSLVSFSSEAKEETIGVSLFQKWEVLVENLDRCACYYDDAEIEDENLIGLAFILEDE